jgi:hypothetical protein
VGHPQKLGERLEQAPRALRKNRSCWYLDLSELRQERFLCFRATWFDNLLQQPQEMNIRAPYHVTLFHNSDWKPHSHEPSTFCEDKVVVMVKNHELAGHSGSHLLSQVFIQEAEIGRMVFWSQPGKNLVRPLISTNKLGMVACTCHPSYMGGEIGGWQFRLA